MDLNDCRAVKPFLFSLLCVLFLAVTSRPVLAEKIELSTEKRLRIVVLASFDQALPWTQNFITGLNTAREQSGQAADFYYEFIDMRRLNGSMTPQMHADYLRAKYANQTIDGVILESRYALALAEAQGAQMFGNVPYVLISSQQKGGEALERVARVGNGGWLTGNVDLIAHLHPKPEQLVVVGGSTALTRMVSNALEPQLAARFPDAQVRQIVGLPLEQLKTELSMLSDRSVVIYTQYLRDTAGGTHIPREIAPVLVNSTSAPVYGLFDTYLGTGVVGGNVISSERIAGDAFRTLLKLLEAADPAVISRTQQMSDIRLDQRVLERFSLDQTRLPENARILFKPVPLYRTYLVETVSLATFLLALFVALVVVTLLLLQKRRLLREVQQSHQQMEQRVAKRTAELRQLATTDQLTGLVNRAEFYRLAQEQYRALQPDQYLSLAVLDLDNFKQVNDNYGHHAGDCVLIEFGDCCRRELAGQAVIGRIGGEEFALLHVSEQVSDCATLLEAFRRSVMMCSVPVSEQGCLQVTTSIGLATVRGPQQTVEKLMQAADQSLYRAKSLGKNQLCCSATHSP